MARRGAKKVIVIGLDGLEPKIVEAMLEAGDLPALANLRTRGGLWRVATTYPAQTPVAWSTFATGVNPGGHGIFDFIRRDPSTYLPDLSLSRYEQKSAFLPPKVVNLRRGRPLWEPLSDAGIPSVVLRCPCTYPPDKLKGRMLSGMGVPDLRGGLGTPTFYSGADSSVEPGESENVVQVRLDGGGRFDTHIIGPRNPKSGEDIKLDVAVHVDRAARKVVIRSGGEPESLEVREGEWSDWLRLKFKAGALTTIRGLLRFYLVRLEPVLELYASPINFDHSAPLFPISTPWDYAAELAGELGTYYTTGMVEDHTGLSNGRFGEQAFLDQCEQVLDEREKMMHYELARLEEGFFFILFDTPDRVQHMFWRFGEDGHPANDGPVPDEMKRVIAEHYRSCDRIVGRALEHAGDDTLFIVMSDHGFNSFQRGVNLNTWLLEQGLLALKPGLSPGEEAGDLLRGIDWSRTRAYALGLGDIYLNLAGREGEGIVGPDEVSAVESQIIDGLTGLADPKRGGVAIRNVRRRAEIYSGPYASESPDLLVGFAEGYRASWATSLGGVPEVLLEDNVKRWGGDHVIDPALVPGVLLANRVLRDGAGMADLAPTILDALGVPKGDAMEGTSLLV